MIATLISRQNKRATVRLTPSWLARLFGARESHIDLEWYVEDGSAGWISCGSRRWLREINHCELIESALDFVPIALPPRAIARRRRPA